MPVLNAAVAEAFLNLADLLEIEGANPFRIRAYRNAARVIASQPTQLYVFLKDGVDLSTLPGIGQDLAGKIKELVRTGSLQMLCQAEKRVGPSIRELLQIDGLGPKRVKMLRDRLKIRSLQDLREAFEKDRLKGVPGFGPLLTKKMKASLSKHSLDSAQRMTLDVAEPIAHELVAYIIQQCRPEQIEVAGSLRRYKETVGDIDLVVAAKRSIPIINACTGYDDVKEVLSKGSTRASVLLHSGCQIDLRVVPLESFGAALHYFTGSVSHNIAIRQRGVKKGLKINEYGVFKKQKKIAGRTERDMYRAVGLPIIPPELRENTGEIEAAERKELPTLVDRDDIKGDLHFHTLASDGQASLEEMLAAAQGFGYQYIAVTDHSKLRGGLDVQGLKAQMKKIDSLRVKSTRCTILSGIEVDILEDGSLDLPDAILKELDYVVCSIHSQFHLSRSKQTDRLMRAIDNRYCRTIGHMTGRLLGSRKGYDIDIERIMQHAKQAGCFIELNAHPKRLDIADIYCRMAKDVGVCIAIGSDAHSVHDFDYLRYGVGQARRGWLTAKDIVNSRTLAKLRALLKR
jgi:DNA polymerase (family 10)